MDNKLECSQFLSLPALKTESGKLIAESRILKDREDETSQLNRLGVAYFHIC